MKKNGIMNILAVLMILIGLPCPAFAGSPRQDKYPWVKLSDNVASRPGAVAWSPDSKKTAFISGSVHIYDAETGRQSAVDILSPVSVSWNGPDELFIISRAEGKGRLHAVDTSSATAGKEEFDIDADAVFPAGNNRKVLALSLKFKTMKIGTDISTLLSLHDMRDGAVRTIYTSSRIYPARKPDIARMTGWMHAGLNPLDGTFLVMEHVKPPVIAPYTKVMSIDTLTAKMRPVVADDLKKSYVSGSWSPDGMRVALTLDNGNLEIIDRQGGTVYADSTVLGLYPSWNPLGSQIFVGGFLVNSDGTGKETLLPAGFDSIAVWSPDGTKLAVISKNELRILEKFRPAFISPDRPFDQDLSRRITMLRELLYDRLLTEDEYNERYRKLMGKKGKAQ